MQLSPRRKALVGLMTIGVLALIGDRLTSGPVPAKGQHTPADTAGNAAPGSGAPAATETTPAPAAAGAPLLPRPAAPRSAASSPRGRA